MCFGKTGFAIVITDVVGLVSYIVHQYVDIVEIDIVILDHRLSFNDATLVIFDEFIGKSLSVKGNTAVRSIV